MIGACAHGMGYHLATVGVARAIATGDAGHTPVSGRVPADGLSAGTAVV